MTASRGASKPGNDATAALDSLDLSMELNTDELIRALKHYRRIARQDILQAEASADGEHLLLHAESRREVYSHLADIADTKPATEVVREALRLYQELPFVTGTPEGSFTVEKGRENALENFFVMVNLPPRVRRTVRSTRSRPADG
ncbi:MAG TPA: hypothetical protein VK092_01035 [Deinococcales bacterium]|nr:hypothetical protein [Deinococcales bacterium]